mmetsp:Transcript_37627/g.74064  ORF Transcript_37627/g.74064 Transcript_37627/m.74064 type:complete len:100 (+) Transcript_37627:63-362(+)
MVNLFSEESTAHSNSEAAAPVQYFSPKSAQNESAGSTSSRIAATDSGSQISSDAPARSTNLFNTALKPRVVSIPPSKPNATPTSSNPQDLNQFKPRRKR